MHMDGIARGTRATRGRGMIATHIVDPEIRVASEIRQMVGSPSTSRSADEIVSF